MENHSSETREGKNTIRKLIDFDFLITRSNVNKIIPVILFLSFLMLVYIANKNYSEKSDLELNKLNNELKDLRAESLTIKADLMNKTKQSEVEKLVKPLGLNSLIKPPEKIVVE